MAKSLREDVEALAAEWASAAERGAKFSSTPTLLRADLASQALRRILDRHQADGGVVVPRDLLAGAIRVTLTEYSTGIATTIAEAAMALPAGTYWIISDEQADAILATKE